MEEKERGRFTVSELCRKIREAPHFPGEQVPVLNERSEACIERIVLAPLSDTESGPTANLPMDNSPQGLLLLNFIFERDPTFQDIDKFADSLKRVWHNDGMPLKRIVWGGYSSWNNDSPLSSPLVIKVIDGFLKRHRQRQALKNAKYLRPPSAEPKGPMTPSSISDSPHTPSNHVQRSRKRRRTRY